MKSFLKKVAYLSCLIVFCISILSFRSSNESELTLTDNFKEVVIETEDSEEEILESKWVARAARVTVGVVTAFVDGDDEDEGDNEEDEDEEEDEEEGNRNSVISQKQIIKMSKL